MGEATTEKKSITAELRESGIELSDRDVSLVLLVSTRAAALATADVIEVLLKNDAIDNLPDQTVTDLEELSLQVGLKQALAGIIEAELADS